MAPEEWNALLRWYERYGRHSLPWRRKTDAWAVLLAECLLHRTRASQVAEVYPGLLDTFSSPKKVILNPDEWMLATASLGLAWRSGLVIDMAGEIVDRFGGSVPAETGDILSLPGVGHYKALAVRCFAFGIPATLVDTNTMRVAARVSGISLSQESHRSRKARQMVNSLRARDGEFTADENLALLDLAAIVCTVKDPNCDACPLRESCLYPHSTGEG